MARKARPARPRANALLMLECDAAKLARQSLGMAASIRNWVALTAAPTRVEIIETGSEHDLLARMGQLGDAKFRTVVAIGHSNETGMRLTADRSLSWQAVGNWLAPFSPQQLVLAACKAGGLIPVTALFSAVPSLQALYATPALALKQQMEVVNALVPYLLNTKNPDHGTIKIGQLVNWALTGNTLWQWRRQEIIPPQRMRRRR